MAELLSVYDNREIEAFAKDLGLLIGIAYAVDREYGEADYKFRIDFEKFKKLIAEWNRKYPNVTIKVFENGIQCDIRIYIHEKSIKQLLMAASQINRLVSINNMACDTQLTGLDVDKYLIRIHDRINFTYYDKRNTENTLTFNIVEGKIELLFEKQDIIDINAPEFQIVAYYALKRSHSIDLIKYRTEFSFDTTELEGRERGFGYERRIPLY
ncbi:hypothetical protein JW930_05340 [Candidatus Woesearchaeota archaeon]|nr:hypothetical protein [Candidatus Woesearchaeota archaeon]